jgi:hypothetical protein
VLDQDWPDRLGAVPRARELCGQLLGRVVRLSRSAAQLIQQCVRFGDAPLGLLPGVYTGLAQLLGGPAGLLGGLTQLLGGLALVFLKDRSSSDAWRWSSAASRRRSVTCCCSAVFGSRSFMISS